MQNYRAATARYCSTKGDCPAVQPIIGADGTALIPVHDRSGRLVAHAVVDIADVTLVGGRAWHLDSDGYVRSAKRLAGDGGVRAIPMHREILGLTTGDGLEADHLDHDKLNNRRANLRAIPRAAQQQNHPSHRGASSKHRGVSFDKQTAMWRAALYVNGKNIHVGRFRSEDEAAEAVRAARLRLMPYAVN